MVGCSEAWSPAPSYQGGQARAGRAPGASLSICPRQGEKEAHPSGWSPAGDKQAGQLEAFRVCVGGGQQMKGEGEAALACKGWELFAWGDPPPSLGAQSILEGANSPHPPTKKQKYKGAVSVLLLGKGLAVPWGGQETGKEGTLGTTGYVVAPLYGSGGCSELTSNRTCLCLDCWASLLPNHRSSCKCPPSPSRPWPMNGLSDLPDPGGLLHPPL